LLLLAVAGLVYFKTDLFTSEEQPVYHQPNKAMISEAEAIVSVSVSPPFNYSFDIMTPGVLQHLDRNYTYDVVPAALEGGFLFQGIHRPPSGTSLTLEIKQPTVISFFFHSKVDGGYGEIFKELEGWVLTDANPQYDIHNGSHGLDMILYERIATPGVYVIPATTKDRACFSIVFQPVH